MSNTVQLVSDDNRFTVWMINLKGKPQGSTRSVLWIELDKEPEPKWLHKWTVEVKIYFPNDKCEERLKGWGKSRHDAFVCLRKRINNLRSLNVRA